MDFRVGEKAAAAGAVDGAERGQERINLPRLDQGASHAKPVVVESGFHRPDAPGTGVHPHSGRFRCRSANSMNRNQSNRSTECPPARLW